MYNQLQILCTFRYLLIYSCILKFEKEEDFVSYEYDLKNLEFNFDHKVSQKAEGNVLPLTIPMFDQDAVFLSTPTHIVFLS